MKLSLLLQSLPGRLVALGIPDTEITGIQEDSRLLKPGNLFIARGGTRTSGAQFLEDARQRGAAAALVEKIVADCALPQLAVADPAGAVALLADAFYGHPSRALKVMGITGTNGKTTTTYLIRHMLQRYGIRCGMIGTVEIDDGASCVEATMTTPSPIAVTAIMARMRDNGCQGCAIEVSSHALHQQRVGAVHFAAGAFTNLTGDHLDYHLTMDNYAAAKAILFEMIPDDAAALINARDPWAMRMVRDTRARVRQFAVELPADYRATDIQITAQGSRFTLHTPRGSAPVQMRLIGRHNIENALTAASCVMETFALTPAQVAEALRDAIGAPGRLQSVVAGQPFAVLVDYAHTDDALKNVLLALRPLTRGKLRVLFGCGGDRDATKRPRMAAVARELADEVYVTSDNPRTEDPQAIINQIIAGMDLKRGTPVHVQMDRQAAIRQIITDARPEDVVLLAGKGHENYQIIGTTKHHFDDVEEATRVLQ